MFWNKPAALLAWAGFSNIHLVSSLHTFLGPTEYLLSITPLYFWSDTSDITINVSCIQFPLHLLNNSIN